MPENGSGPVPEKSWKLELKLLDFYVVCWPKINFSRIASLLVVLFTVSALALFGK